MIFGVGDCVYQLGNRAPVHQKYPNNAPPYMAYQLVNTSLMREKLQVQVYENIALSDWGERSLLIGSDGIMDLYRSDMCLIPGKREFVGHLHQFSSEDRYVNNPEAINRRLRLINSPQHRVVDGRVETEHGLLPDDTSLIAFRYKDYQ